MPTTVRLIAAVLALFAATPCAASAQETFSDGFESGGLSAWTVATDGGGTASAQSTAVHAGSFAARLSETSGSTSFAYARRSFAAAQTDVVASAWVDVQADGAAKGNVPLLRLLDASGNRVVSVYRQNQNADRVWVSYAGLFERTSGRLALSTWAQVELRVTAAGVEVRLNGASVYQASTAGLAPVRTVQIGNESRGQTFAIVVDDVELSGGSAPPPPPPPPGDPVVVGAGDIAECNNGGDEATATLLDGIAGTVLTLGDNVYPTGSLSLYNSCYEPSWGRHKARTRPSLGNHEYDVDGNTGYFDYFGSAAGLSPGGYYSYDVGTWHVVVLNSNCALVLGGCGAGSAQEQWLRQDLAANAASCTLAYWHHPRFSSGGEHGNDPAMDAFWRALYDGGADVVLNGHDHHYERFAPQDPSGAADATYGIREWIVGTGGKSHYALGTIQPNSVARNTDTFGVLELTLHDGSYDWAFMPEAGKTYADAGSGACHTAPAPPPPPPPGGSSDGFESGDFSAWSSVTTAADGTAAVQGAFVHDGALAARLRATSTAGSVSYVRRSLSTARTEVSFGGWFNIQAEGASGANVPLLRVFDPSGARLASVYRQNQGGDALWVHHSGAYNATTGKLALGAWGHVRLHVIVAGSGASTVEVFLNGTRIYQTTTASLGTAGVLTCQIGNNTAGQAFELAADTLEIATPG